MSTAEKRIEELKLTLPPAPRPVAKYRPAVQVGNLLYISGHGPAKIAADSPVLGKVGAELTLEQGQACGSPGRPEHPGHPAQHARLAR